MAPWWAGGRLPALTINSKINRPGVIILPEDGRSYAQAHAPAIAAMVSIMLIPAQQELLQKSSLAYTNPW